MTEISICGYGVSVEYWSHDVHGFYTKNETRKRKIKELCISIGEIVTPKITWSKTWMPTYKITVTWDNQYSEIWNLVLLLEQLKGIKFKIPNVGTKIEIFCSLPDNIRNNICRIIEGLSYNSTGNDECSEYSDDFDVYKYFKTETVVEKW